MDMLKRVGHVLSTALVVLVAALAIALVGGRLLGFEAYAVLSGSMEPTYHVGSLIWVDRCDASEVEVGDPITFVMNEDLDVATHRVIAVDTEAGEFTTQGDANESPDGSPVLFENLVGVPVLTVPYLGYLVSYVKSPPGCYVALIVAAAVLALMLVFELLDRGASKSEGAAHAQPDRIAHNPGARRGAVSVPRGAAQADNGQATVMAQSKVARPRAASPHGRVTYPQATPAYGQLASQRAAAYPQSQGRAANPQAMPDYGRLASQQARIARPQAAPSPMTPEQRAFYAQRELERRRSMRQAPNQGIAFDSHSNVPSGRFERRETR